MVKISKAAADEKLQQAYSMYGNLLTKYCTVRLGEAIASVDDCIQNAFLIYYNKILNGETIENPKAFLYRVADNMVKRCVSEYYSDAKRRADLETAENISVDESFEHTADLDYDYLKEILINKLSEDEQLLYQQKYVQRLSLKELGDYYSIKPAAVANRTSRLRTKIKSLIDEVLEENDKGGNLF